MAIKKLDSTKWDSYFGSFSKDRMHSHRVDYAEIRVFSREIGAQKETDWLPLEGITYDPKAKVLEINVTGLDHLVYQPAEIYVDEVDGVLASVEVTHPDGTIELIELR